MNLAFVVLTSALLGNHPAASSCNTCSAPAPAATCDTCGPTCGHSHRFRFDLNRLFPCHTCKPACEAPCAAPAPAPACCEAPKCATCNSCGHGHGGGFFTRFRGLFSGHGHHNSCDTCAPACDTCNGATAAPAAAPCAPAAPGTAPAGQGTEAIKDAPKKMPVDPKGDAPPKTETKGDKATRFNEAEPTPLAIPAVPAVTTVNPAANNQAPAVIVAPATIRNPF